MPSGTMMAAARRAIGVLAMTTVLLALPRLTVAEDIDWARVRSIIPGCEARQDPAHYDPKLTSIEMLARADYYYSWAPPHADRCEALHWMIAAARRENVGAYKRIVTVAHVAKDETVLNYMIRLAAEHGDDDSQYRLGFESGAEPAAALSWLRQAAEANNLAAVGAYLDRVKRMSGVDASLAEKRRLADAGVAVAPRSRSFDQEDNAAAGSWNRAAAEQGHRGAILRDCDDCPELIVITPGEFTMGDRFEDGQTPAHAVAVPRPFAMGRFEASRREWNACVLDHACAPKAGASGKRRSGPPPALTVEKPVTGMTWNEARTFVAWLGRRTGKIYRLPTEAEWEHAIRGHKWYQRNNRYWWGNRFWPQVEANWRNGRNSLPRPGEEDDGSNEFRLHDMAGGIAEWVADCWHASYQGAPSDGSAWSAPDCVEHVVRGGHENAPSTQWRSAFRRPGRDSDEMIGLRVARELPEARGVLQRVCLRNTNGDPVPMHGSSQATLTLSTKEYYLTCLPGDPDVHRVRPD